MPSGTSSSGDSGAAKISNDMSNTNGKQKRKKRRMDKEKFTSLSVACVKRLLPVGMNIFGGREQELVQLAKHKMIEVGRERVKIDLVGEKDCFFDF